MDKKRNSIRTRLRRMVLILCVTSLAVSGTVGLAGLFAVRGRVLSDSRGLGSTAAQTSEEALLSQMKQNLLRVVTDKASLADVELGRFREQIETFANYISALYENPERYVPRDVPIPDAANAGVNTMQRVLATEDVSITEIREEMELLGNVEQIFDPVISQNPDTIATIYLGTKSGVMISYDKYSDSAATGGESYYDFFSSNWYPTARDANGTIFTDVYDDVYGRGLTITCAAPFYDGDEFMGVVSMDILVDDLNRMVIDVDFSAGSYAFLVDRTGAVIASPDSWDDEGFTNIYDTGNPISAVADAVMSGASDVLSVEDTYYGVTPISSASWHLVVSVPEGDIVAPAQAIRENIVSKTNSTADSMDASIKAVVIFFAVAFVAVAVAVAALSSRFSNNLTKPLLALGDDVKKISGGDLKYRAHILTNDEIGDLAGEFNMMTESLDKYVRDLTTMTAEKERIGAELNVATQIQSSMLPSIFPAFPERQEFDIFASMTPAKEVGGDFYDFFMVDERHLAIVMADVSGKGVPAALFMVIGKTLIKDHTVPDTDLGVVFMEVNRLLCQSNSEGLFITAFEGVLDLVTGQFNFVNAGHEMPFIKKAGGRFEPQKIRAGFVLAGMEGVKYRMGTMKLEPGDKLFQYTDGVTEATNANEELYGMERLEAVLNKNGDLAPMALLPAVKADIDQFVGEAPQFDDITMLCLEYKKVMEGTDFYEITIDAKVENIPVVTDFVNRRLEEFNCPESILSHIDIAVDELFSNIAQYAYSTGDGMATVRVETENDPPEAIITFIDKGKAYDPLNFADPDTSVPIEDRDLGGLGRYIVRKTMDSVIYDYKSGQNILTIRKSLTL